jgi:hypothetical protein
LIDLVVRKALKSAEDRGIKQPTWKGSPWNVQVNYYIWLLWREMENGKRKAEREI